MAMNRDMRALTKRLEAQGWTIELTRGGHVRCTAPTGEPVFAAQTPSDWRAVKNFRAHCKKLGAVLA